MNKLQKSKYFFPREQQTIKEVTQKLGLEFVGGNDLWGWKRRSLYDSRYVFRKPDEMSIDEYVEKCKQLPTLLTDKYVPAVIIKADALKIFICHPKLILPCDDKGMLDENRCRDLKDPTALEYERKFPQNCFIYNA